jgi:hypothetical protein
MTASGVRLIFGRPVVDRWWRYFKVHVAVVTMGVVGMRQGILTVALESG